MTLEKKVSSAGTKICCFVGGVSVVGAWLRLASLLDRRPNEVRILHLTKLLQFVDATQVIVVVVIVVQAVVTRV